MNEIAEVNFQMPNTIDDLTKWDMFFSARIPLYKKLLKNVTSWEEASEEEKRILRRAQEEAENLVDIHIVMGEIYKNLPEKAGRPTEIESTTGRNLTPKQEYKEQTGLSDSKAKRFVSMSENPEIVAEVKAEARENNDIATQTEILKRIELAKKEEREKLSAEMRDLKEEKDYYESLLENQREQTADLMDEIDQREKKISELIEEVEKPARDFEKEKKKALAALEADYKAEKNKVDEKQKEILRLRDRIAELEGATMEGLEHGNLSENVYYFCMLANNFVGNAGGLVWLTERIADMPKKEMELFLKAAHALEAFSLAFVQNLERSGHGGRSNGADGRGEVPVITDQKEHRKN